VTTTETLLPLSHTVEVESTAELEDAVRQAYRDRTPLYPIGGGTSLDYGMPAREPGWGIDLSRHAAIVDYPVRDLTVTVSAGVRWSELQQTLRQNNQELPLDVPDADRATVGGVVATAWTGPRRLAYGSVRDYVIGIEAVDGRGTRYRGGGRVVKNVAGYDFCKLLTGSLGTLGVISQVTFRVRPAAEARRWLTMELEDWEQAWQLACRLRKRPLAAVTMGIVAGPGWATTAWDDQASRTDRLFRFGLLVEGLEQEVAGAVESARQAAGGVGQWQEVDQEQAVEARLAALTAFPASRESPLIIRAKTVASGAAPFARAVTELDAAATMFCDLGTGTVDVRFSQFPTQGLSATLVRSLQPIAARYGGHVRLLRNESGGEMTHQVVWSELGLPVELMANVKRAFDPADLLNRGRFVW